MRRQMGCASSDLPINIIFSRESSPNLVEAVHLNRRGRLGQSPLPDSRKAKRELQTLLHPEMLGRAFQVLALAKNVFPKRIRWRVLNS